MTEKIPEKMQAVVCHGPHDYRLEEVAVPERKPTVSAPPERVYLFDIDSGERLR